MHWLFIIFAAAIFFAAGAFVRWCLAYRDNWEL